jgi:hypothetical protein
MRHATEIVARLERQALDERRLVLTALAGELALLRASTDDLERRLAREHDVAFELPGGPQPLAAYAHAARARVRAFRDRERELCKAVAAAEIDLGERVRAWKSLDLAASRERERQADAEMRCTWREVEEAGVLRLAATAQNSGASVTSRPSSASANLIWQDSREMSRTSNASSSIIPSSEFAASSRGSQVSST